MFTDSIQPFPVHETLVQEAVARYLTEEDKLTFAKMKLLHLFFEKGVAEKYDVLYLESLCSYLDSMCNLIFQEAFFIPGPATGNLLARLLHFALIPDLEYLASYFRFNEAVFAALEDYEVCANINYVQKQIATEIMRKATQNRLPQNTL